MRYAKYILTALLAAGLVACGPDSAAPKTRINAVTELPQANTQFKFEKSEIWPAASQGACARLLELYQEPSQKRSRFAFLARPFSFSKTVSGEITAFGALDLSKSPLMQFVLGTPAIDENIGPVLTADDEEFLRLAYKRLRVEECKAEQPKSKTCEQNLSDWDGANTLKREGLLHKQRSVAVGNELNRR